MAYPLKFELVVFMICHHERSISLGDLLLNNQI